MKNKHLSRAIANQKFSEFRIKWVYKAKVHNIEIRLVDRFYPSRKLCGHCGDRKKDLKLSDRVYKCPHWDFACDRDLNASFNLKNATKYKIL